MNQTPAGPKPPILRRIALALYALYAVPFAVLVGRNVAFDLRFEDALIVLRYARNLLAGEGFVFNPGERVLGVTTPLHTLMSAVYVGLSPEHAPSLQNLAGLLFLVAEGFLAVVLVRRMGYSYLGLFVALLVLGSFNLSYLYFGMEIHLFTFLVLLAFYLYIEKKEALCGVVLGLAFLTRYDAALMAGLIGLGLLSERRRFPWRLTLGFAAPVVPWLVFAQLYFGSILPNPLGAKEGYYSASGYLHRVFFEYKVAFKKLIGLYAPVEFLKAGLSYLYLFPVLAGGIATALRDRRWALLAVYPFLHVLVYATIGSDPGFTWHYYILNPIWYIFFVAGLYEIVRAALRPISERFSRRYAEAVVVTVALLPLLVHSIRGLGQRYEMDPHTEQLYEIASWLREGYSEETSLLQPAIGILGYETNFRMIDHAGLVTPGLYFFDDQNCTPIDEVIERFAPDLVLLSESSRADVTVHGYREVREFEGPFRYSLFERPTASRP